ncbi:MAG TPA: trigger factor [Caldisericia bacterium]|nr:trigger factor [Caldisericia bacterium]HQN48228.1 trigger factor [Caldisericia bacterium]HQP00100.1 trigger factor [Caldisericia bacterium]
MNISIKSEDKNKLEFEISYDLEEYDKTYNKILNKFRNKVKIPGFRPGKAPDNMIKNAVGEDAIIEELKKEIRDSSIEKIFNENKELFPSIESNFSEFSKENLKFYLTTYKIPEVKSVDLNEIINNIKDIKEEDIDKKIKQIQEEMKEFVPKEKGVIENGDYVIFKYRFNKEDDFKEIAVIVGEKKNILEDHLIGLSKGERKEININNNNIEIEISEIKSPKYPEINEGFIKDFGVNSIDEFKLKVKDIILKERFQDDYLERMIQEKLIKINDFYIPKSYIKDETYHKIEHLKEELLKSGYTIEDFLKERGETLEELEKNFDINSMVEIKYDIILDILSKDIEVSDDDIKNQYPDNYDLIINNEEQKNRVIYYLKKVKYLGNIIEELKKIGGADGI